MKNTESANSSHQLWAEFRFGVIGGLLSNPPDPGDLRSRLKHLSETQWRHPLRGEKFQVSLPTVERWYYASSKQGKDPVGALRRKLRRDSGTTRHLTPEMKAWLQSNYRAHPSWSGQLHCDNLKVWLEQNPDCGMAPSYATVLRYMRTQGWDKKPRVRSPHAPGRVAAANRLESREVRSYEVEYVGGLWHLDFHHASRQLRNERGEMATPLALCVLDDHSRLVCHLQWFWSEDTRSLVHGFTQAVQKRGLPRAVMSDQGAAMTSAEFREGFMRLGVTLEHALAYSPYQNGKQESFWGNLEGRMMAMLESKRDLTIEELNQVSQAWMEGEYNRKIHSETSQAPLDRWLNGKSVLRESPTHDVLKLAFRRDEDRTQRRSDGTVSILGKRFEIPAAYRTLPKIVVRYAEWDLRQVHLIDPRTQAQLAPLYPVDKQRNAEGLRKKIGGQPSEKAVQDEAAGELPPLLAKLVAEHAASGLPAAYIPLPSEVQEPEEKDREEGRVQS